MLTVLSQRTPKGDSDGVERRVSPQPAVLHRPIIQYRMCRPDVLPEGIRSSPGIK